MLSRRRILIAEDHPIVAYGIARAVEDAGGEVVGPVASVEEGLSLLQRAKVDAAILDVGLADRDVAPIAESLLKRGVVVVFHTAAAVPAAIVERHGPVVVCPKPMDPDRVVQKLATLINRGA